MSKWSNYSTNYSGLNSTSPSSDFTIPDGKYMVKVELLELAESKKGYPMISGKFRIIDGDLSNKLIYVNQIVLKPEADDSTNARLIKRANQFLLGFHIVPNVTLDYLDNYDALITDIFNVIARDNLGYLVDINHTSYNGNSYQNVRIDQGPFTLNK